jgi:DNA-binding MarR family transcriptional regulator
MSATAPLPRPQRERSSAADDLEARLIATLPQVMRHLLAHARRRPAWRKLTYQQYNVLRIIRADGSVAPGEVARRLMVSPPVVTRQATSLVKAGLVERKSDLEDRRAQSLELTDAGRRTVTAMRRDLLAAARELIEPLPAERRAAVAAALDELEVLLPGRPGSGDIPR